MSKRTAHDESLQFLARFDALSDSVPLADDEVDELLASAGIQPEAAFGRLQTRVKKLEAVQRKERFARAAVDRQAQLRRLEVQRPKRSRTELLAQMDALKAQLPAGRTLQAHFRNYESAPVEDLETLVADFEALIEREKGK